MSSELPAQVFVYWNPHREDWTVLVHKPYMKGSTLVMDRKYTSYDVKDKADGAAMEFAKVLLLAGRPKVEIIEDDNGKPKVVWSSK